VLLARAAARFTADTIADHDNDGDGGEPDG
jgi:hypothetical protein